MSEPERGAEPAPEQPVHERDVEELRKQLDVLERKLLDATEPVVREALQMRMTQIMQELGPDLVPRPAPRPSPQAPRKEEPLPEPPTAEQQIAADNLIRQAKVAKMRGQNQEATRLIQQAAETAPGSAIVLETLGDEYLEHKRYGEARVAYEKAHRVDPSNVALERKFAEMVLRTTAGLNVDVAMALGGDSPFLNPSEATASAWAATVFSVLAPGSGQIVLGETKKGFILIVGWVLCLIAIGLMQTDMQGLFSSVGGRHVAYSPFIFVPLVVILAIYITAIGGCSSRIKKHWTPSRITEKPVPPVNLPFE